MTSATYQVTGMACEHCVHAVTGELENLDGVREVRVDLHPGGASALTVTSEAPLAADAGRRPPWTRPEATSSPGKHARRGVTAAVNFATEKASVSFPAAVSPGRPDLGRRAGRLHGRAACSAGGGGRAGA